MDPEEAGAYYDVLPNHSPSGSPRSSNRDFSSRSPSRSPRGSHHDLGSGSYRPSNSRSPRSGHRELSIDDFYNQQQAVQAKTRSSRSKGARTSSRKARSSSRVPTITTWLESNTPNDIPQGLVVGDGRIASGIRSDYSTRFTFDLFKSDYIIDSIPCLNKTLTGSFWMFCMTFLVAIALGCVAFRETEGFVGITEYLLVQGVAGIFHTLASANPLTLLRPTAPVTAIMADLYDLTAWVDSIQYYTLLSWAGLWVGLFLIVISILDLSKYVALCNTRFMRDTYSVFVCLIYIVEGIKGVVANYNNAKWEQAFYSFYLCLICVVVALVISHIKQSKYIFNRQTRKIISNYAIPMAVLISIGISYTPSGNNVNIERIEMPRPVFEPTYARDGQRGNNPRGWYQGLGGDGWLAAGGIAFLVAIPIVCLFYIEHMLSLITSQKPELGLEKGQYYHSSLLIIGIINLILPSFGMPFVTASLPYSTQFVKALSDKTKSPPKAHETRIAPLLVYALCFLGLVVPSMLELCPMGVINGVLAFIGLQGLMPGNGNQFIDRCLLLVTAPSEYNSILEETQATSASSTSYYLTLPWYRIHLLTTIQIGCLAACWGMRFAGPFALAFPFVILAWVPVRLWLLPQIFTNDELAVLDMEEAVVASTAPSPTKDLNAYIRQEDFDRSYHRDRGGR